MVLYCIMSVPPWDIHLHGQVNMQCLSLDVIFMWSNSSWLWVYHIDIPQVCDLKKKKMSQSDSVLFINGFGDDTFHASCTLVFYSYSDGNINTIPWSGRKNAVSTDIPNLADSAMYTPKICVFRSDRKKQLQKNK